MLYKKDKKNPEIWGNVSFIKLAIVFISFYSVRYATVKVHSQPNLMALTLFSPSHLSSQMLTFSLSYSLAFAPLKAATDSLGTLFVEGVDSELLRMNA